MPRRQIRQRSLLAYSLHGRDGELISDYSALFLGLAQAPALDRQTSVGDEIVALTVAEPRRDSCWVLRFVSGHSGMPPIFYDPVTATESTADLGSRFVAAASWVFLDVESRMVLAERDRPGVPINVIARALSHLGRELNLAPNLVIDLNPVASAGFLVELERFTRIRQASVVLARPNYNWAESSNQLSGYADESNAGTVDVVMSAGRAQSLSIEGGIVPDIKSLTSAPIGPVKNLRVTGTREGETKETTVSLAKHQEKRFVPIGDDAGPAAVRDSLESVAMAFLDELRERALLGRDEP